MPEKHQIDQFAELRSLVARCDQELAPPRVELQEALERGFSQLISLEATLQRTRADAGRWSAEDDPRVQSLVAEIATLQAVLDDLRRRLPAGGRSGLLPGFVLPVDG